MWARLSSQKGIKLPLLQTELAGASKDFSDVASAIESDPVLIDTSEMVSSYNLMLNLE